MAVDLIQSALDGLSEGGVQKAAGALGTTDANVKSGLRGAIAIVIGSLVAKSQAAAGASEIVRTLSEPWHRDAAVRPETYIGDQAARSGQDHVVSLLGSSRIPLLDYLTALGGKADTHYPASISNLATSLALGALFKAVGGSPTPENVRAALRDQDGFVRRDTPAGLNPFIAVVSAREPAAVRRGLPWWAWLIGALVLLALVLLLARSCQPHRAAIATTPSVTSAPATVPAAPGAKVVDKYVIFDTDSTLITPSAQKYVEEAAEELRGNPGATASLIGTADQRGSTPHNQALSEGRNAAVEAALIAAGVESNRIVKEAKGELAPKASNDTAAGMQRNRSVDIQIREPGQD